jgi:hypothetical protein
MRRLWLLLSLIVSAVPMPTARAQISGQASSGAAAAVPAWFTAYSNAELHLTYTYPAQLTPVDGAFAVTAARRMIYGDAESDLAKADRCAKVLLSVGEGSESRGAWTRVGLVQVDGQCYPPKWLQKKKDTLLLLGNLVRQGTTVMGMMPLERPTGYQIEGHWASFCAAQGQPVTMSDVQTAEQQMVGLAAVQAGSRVLAWVIETNDTAMFNRLLGTGVDFGTGKPEQLFGGGIR